MEIEIYRRRYRQKPQLKNLISNFQVAVVGESAVGKTSICHQLSSDGTDFPKNYLTTTLSDVLVKSIKIPDSNDLVELFLIDSSGNSIYHDLLKECWSQSNLIVAVYDVTKEESFGNVSKVSTVFPLIIPPLIMSAPLIFGKK